MALNANFLADFTSYLDATATAIAATNSLTGAAQEVGPAVDKSLGEAGQSLEATGQKAYDAGFKIGQALNSQEMRRFAGDVKQFTTTYIAEFAEAEQATVRLNAALVSSGQTAPAVAESYAKMATSLQQFSTFSDEAITEAQTLLTTIGNVKPDAMEATLKATMDLAVGMGKTLPQAAQMMATAAATNGESLGRMKNALKDSIEPGADFAGVMAAINKEFGGQSAAALASTAGQIAQLNNQMSDINETIGGVLAENLRAVLGIFQALPEGVQTFTVAIVAVGTALAPVLISFSSLISILGATGIGAGLMSFFSALLPFLGPVGLLAVGVIGAIAVWKNWDQIVVIVQRMYEGVKTWLWDKMSGLINSVASLPGKVTAAFQSMYQAVIGHSSVPDTINGIASQFGRLDSVMVQPALSAASSVVDTFQRASDAVQGMVWNPGTKKFSPWAYGPETVFEAPGWVQAGGGASSKPANVNITINMSGMMGTDDPQTRAWLRQMVSDALMQGMRESRLMGTA